jgi:tyrosyl-DNA phosphodiesterase-1
LLNSGIPVVLANDYSSNEKYIPIQKEFCGWHNLTLISPKKDISHGGYSGAFHPKLWLLKFPSFLRLTIF